MRKLLLILLILIVCGAILLSFRFLFGGSEDDWIKDERGVWVKHGNPSAIPQEVQEQQNAITSSLALYQTKKTEGMNFSSQCLGTTSGYAVDIVHVPRSQEDNLQENQCEDYKTGKVEDFIEIDKEGNIIRIVK